MTKNTKIILGIVIVVLMAAGIWYFVCKNKEMGEGKLVTGLPEQTFSGTITAVDTGCFVDAVCSVSVDGKKVIVVMGRMLGEQQSVGKLLGVESIGDVEGKIGAHANVYAATTTTPGEWTLYGNENYYIEVVDLKK